MGAMMMGEQVEIRRISAVEQRRVQDTTVTVPA
jgi:hypothetical protein